MCYRYLHQSKPFLKHLELKTCGCHNGRHSENFHCRVWAKITILVPSYKSYDHIVTPRRVSSSYRLHVHTFIMHALGWKVRSLTRGLLYGTEKIWKMKKGVGERPFVKRKSRASKCEVAKLDLFEQVPNFKSGKGMSTQSPLEALSVHVLHKENIIGFSPQHSTSMGYEHWSGNTSSLFQL